MEEEQHTPGAALVPITTTGAARSTLELAPQTWSLANRLQRTDFVPDALKGKPEAIMAAMLTGAELDIPPMQALKSIHVVKGRPALSAELMRALVLRAGHELWFEEKSATRVIAAGSRKGSTRESRVTWTHDQAKNAGLLGKDNWKHYPEAMLTARATSQLCRDIFPDVLAGLGHSIEELTDGDFDDDPPAAPDVSSPRPAPAARKTAKANRRVARAEQKPEEPLPEPPQGAAPPLPGETDDDIVDGEIVDDDETETETPPIPEEDLAEDGYVEPDTNADGPRYSGPQVIAIRLGELGVKDRETKLRIVSDILRTEVTTTKELDHSEITTVLESLEHGLPDLEPATDFAAEIEADETAAAEANETADETEPTAGRRRRRSNPEEWDAEAWRTYLRSIGMKVIPVIRRAAEIVVERSTGDDQLHAPTNLEEIAGLGIAEELRNWAAQQ